MPFTDKYLRTLAPIEAGHRLIKRYLSTLGAAIEEGVQRPAGGMLPRLLPAAISSDTTAVAA
jgi:hypothetical protein